jgi:hypothetical protein
VGEIARVGRNLLTDPDAIAEGLQYLEAYVEEGVRSWKTYLAKRSA